MKPRTVLFLAVALLVCLIPVALATGQVPDTGEGEQSVSELPDPSPQLQRMEQAYVTGDEKAMDEAAEEVRAETLAKMPADEREAAEAAPPAPKVPPGTLAYVSPYTSDETVKKCEEILGAGREEPLCKLVVLHSEGKLRAGAFSADEVKAVLAPAAR
jgi:hypothetical protein